MSTEDEEAVNRWRQKKQQRDLLAADYGMGEVYDIESNSMFALLPGYQFMDCRICGVVIRYTHPVATAEAHLNSPMVNHWLAHMDQEMRGDLLAYQEQMFMQSQEAANSQAREEVDQREGAQEGEPGETITVLGPEGGDNGEEDPAG